jgi:Putative Ig domain
MANPIWQTNYNLGTFNNNTIINIPIVATAVPPAMAVSYSLAAGVLPTGLELSSDGFLTGIVLTSYTNNVFTFTIKATDNLGNYSLRTFQITAIIIIEPPTWFTPAGSIGQFTENSPLVFQFQANPVSPATSVTYRLISSELPSKYTLSTDGLLTGLTDIVPSTETYNFVIRATDNLQNIKDRSFSLSITGTARPTFTIPSGSILNTLDSIWIELPITYNNPIPNNQVSVILKQGILPPGLEINSQGLIRGYPQQPVNEISYPQVTSSITQTSTVGNLITCLSTLNFSVGRPIVFTGTSFGSIVPNQTYYINAIESATTFTISTTQNGSPVNLINDTGFMAATLPGVNTGNPTIRTYSFILELQSLYGNDTANYSITVVNQNLPISQGGPGYPPNTRVPTLLNTRPLTYNISATDPYYGYYLPVNIPSTPVDIGTYKSGEYFSFKMIGYDFDGNDIKYSFSNIPLGLTADPVTGWISGIPTLQVPTLNQYNFSVAVYKSGTQSIISPYFNFTMEVSKDIVGTIIWDTESDLGTIYNGVLSTLYVKATCGVPLTYNLVDGALPPNLTLLYNGQITGYVAFQPTDQYLNVGETSSFTFTIEAFSAEYSAIKSNKTFTINVLQEFSQPTDTLYIKCTPSVNDRLIIESLLTDTTIIPDEVLYRPQDQYFGKANSVIYEHAYGIYASEIQQYIASVQQSYYWRNITLGELQTAVAKDDNGNVLYEVVYSQIIDDLTKPDYYVITAPFIVPGQTYTIVYAGSTDFTSIGAADNKTGTIFTATGFGVGTGTVAILLGTTSISSEIYWPYFINLNLGPWYTSSTLIYDSYENIGDQQFYTSLTPGYARTLYPNSLQNMRNQVANVLGQQTNSKLLPLWMTSQQSDGSTTGYVPAWVICYTLPGFSNVVKNNIKTMWPYTLNQINFKIDRFSVDKSNTYDFDNNLSPPAWTSYPSADPVPNPLDSKDFNVLFPRQTILPDQTQY